MALKGSHVSKAHISYAQHSAKYYLSNAECSDLTDPANGMVVMAGNSIGDTASYTCNSSFGRVGVDTLTCQSDGTWSDPPPICEPIGMKNPLYFSSSSSQVHNAGHWNNPLL